jgi:predicted  nucleic acid-binding Zn-ribbon protein
VPRRRSGAPSAGAGARPRGAAAPPSRRVPSPPGGNVRPLGALDDLLRLQDHDTAADRLRHRRATLPERAELKAREQRLRKLDSQLLALQPQRQELAARRQRLEDELASVERRAGELQRRLYSGTVTAPRDLQAMQADAASFERHRGKVEDELLEVMEQLVEERSRAEDEAEALRGRIEEAGAAIDSALRVELEGRAAALVNLPDDLVSLYERLRHKLNGVGAARLVNGTCDGCHLALPATQLDSVKFLPADAVVRCDQCGRILVR